MHADNQIVDSQPATERLVARQGSSESSRAPLRVTMLAVMPSPYMIDLFDAMRADPRLELAVCFLEKPAVAAPGVYWQERPLPEYAEVLPGRWFYFLGARVHINLGLTKALKATRPDVVVVVGYSSLTCQFAMYWLSVKRIPWVFWGEVPGFERRGLIGRILRRFALTPVAKLSSGIAAIGARAQAAYSEIAGRSKLVKNIPYYCRNEQLLAISRNESSTPAHFLFCGQMVARKGVDLLIRAFCRVAREYPDIRLTLVGDGPLSRELKDAVPAEIKPRVEWAGFQEPEQLPRFFQATNVFVLPSLHDGWGVVINQAVSAGMAVIASDTVGAAVDLVSDGENGKIVPSQNEPELEQSLRFFAERPGLIPEYGKKSRQRGNDMTPSHGVERWHRFLDQVLSARKR